MRERIAIGSIAATREFALALSKNLQRGDLLLLDGPLGAGKTLFAQALAKALNVEEEVTSPTFVMVKSYQGRIPVNHIDAYRLLDLENPLQAFEELDVDFENSLTIVEWGKGFDVTGMALHITFELGEGEERILLLEGSDSRWGQLKL